MALAEAGAIGFKIFTKRAPPGRESEFAGLCAVDDASLLAALQAVSTTGLTCTIHAESQLVLDAWAPFDCHRRPEPPLAEAVAISVAASCAEAANARIHVAHVTSRLAVNVLRALETLGADVTAETCPQYLLLTNAAVSPTVGFAKVAPPLRTVDDQEALWEALRTGHLSAIASDHAPFTFAEKQTEYKSAPSGLPSVEVLVPTAVDAGLTGALPLELAIELVTSRPAKIFGLYPHKGTIREGFDADLVIIDPKPETRVDVSRWNSRAGACGEPFDGLLFQGQVVETLLRGQTVARDGVPLRKPIGQMIRPILESAA